MKNPAAKALSTLATLAAVYGGRQPASIERPKPIVCRGVDVAMNGRKADVKP